MIPSAMSDILQIGTHSAISPTPSPTLLRLQSITIAWMLLELAVSAYAAFTAHSPAILAFAADSLVELLSATVVLLQFAPRFTLSEQKAARASALLLLVLTLFITAISIATLALHIHPAVSCSGIAITLAALIAMPILATLKHREARRTQNPALAADAVQSAACAWLALTALAGLAANALLHLPWLDPVAALAATPILHPEARSAWRGHTCACC
jgi:divalent metal cation (Fe/Co/Zn/Cd) transporter